MQITFYGTGSCMPTPKTSGKPFRSYTGWYIEIGSDSLLFDIGGGLLHKMLEDGKDILKQPTHLFISHFHPDHCSDIVSLMQGRGVYNSNVSKLQKLFVGGPEGLEKFTDEVFNDIEKWRDFAGLEIKSLLDLHEVKNGLVGEGENWKVSASPIEHFNGVCYRLDADDKSIVYSGDMTYDENIAKIGKDADIAIFECSYPDRESLKGKHLCPEDIGKLAKMGNFKKVVLTHMYPACEGREDEMAATIKNIANCEVVVAQDFLKLEL